MYKRQISTSWRSQNEAAANSIAQAYATQLLIWETVIGERDANFNHVAASGCLNSSSLIGFSKDVYKRQLHLLMVDDHIPAGAKLY